MLAREQERTATALRRFQERIARTGALDRIGDPAAATVRRLMRAARAKELLSGGWIGHPLHPILTDIPIGSFTSATVLDLVGGPRARRGADLLVWLGVASVLPTVAAGAADWSDTVGAERRIGVVHAVTSLVGVCYYARSSAARRHGSPVRAAMLGIVGMTWMTVGGYLGGHLVYGRGVGVTRAGLRTLSARRVG